MPTRPGNLLGSEYARILVYDIESTSLDADTGDLLVFGWKWLGEKKVHTPSVLDTNDPCDDCGRIEISEKALVKEAYAVMSQADVCVTFNGQRFDSPYMNTKFLMYGLDALPSSSQVDLYQVLRHKTRMSSKRLANAALVFKLNHEKTVLDWAIWRRAAKGYVKDIKYIRDHADADVLVTEELYGKLRQHVRQHPRVNGYAPCRRCGEDTLQRRGRAITIYRGQQFRFQCKSCGGWETRAAA